MGFRRRFNLTTMKKILFILLFICSIAQAQYAGSGIFKTAFISSKVARFRDSLFTLSSNPNLYADTNKYYATMEFQRGLLRANLDTCFYLQYLFIYLSANSATLNYEYRLNPGAVNEEGKLINTGSPTLNANGITYNGTTQFSGIRQSNGQLMSPRYLLETTYGKSSTDTVANTGMNLDIFNKNTTDNPFFIAGFIDGSPLFKSISTSIIGTTLDYRAYNNNVYKTITYTGDRNGLLSLNRITNKQYVYLRGIVQDSLISSTFDYGLARQIGGTGTGGSDPNFYLQALPWVSAYFSGTVQYAAIRKRGFTPTEMTAYNNLVTALQQRLGR